MKWSRSTVGLFILSMTLMVVSGFMLLMFLGTSVGEPGHDFARVGLAVCLIGFVLSGVGAWLNHQRRRRAD